MLPEKNTPTSAGRQDDPPPDALPDDQRTGDEPNPSGQPETPQRARIAAGA